MFALVYEYAIPFETEQFFFENIECFLGYTSILFQWNLCRVSHTKFRQNTIVMLLFKPTS